MEWLIIVLLLLLVGGVVFLPMLAGLVGIGLAVADDRKAEKPAARLARADEILAETFDGRLNASYERQPTDPITVERLMGAASEAGYALVTTDTTLGVKTYHFTRSNGGSNGGTN